MAKTIKLRNKKTGKIVTLRKKKTKKKEDRSMRTRLNGASKYRTETV